VEECKGRLSNADIYYASKYLAILTSKHQLISMIVEGTHRYIMHNNVKEMLTEIKVYHYKSALAE